MQFVFVKHSLSWPRCSGQDVHCYHMMRALRALGHDVALATVTEPVKEAIAGLELSAQTVLDGDFEPPLSPPLSWLQERFRSYWGVDRSYISALGQFSQQVETDVVVAVGLEILPYLTALRDCCRVWYAADEWVWHHLSLLNWDCRETLTHLQAALIKGFYERSFGDCMDRVWVVSDADRRAMNWVTGVSAVDVVPNGVDTDYYFPRRVATQESTCVFWGRLDYEPNIRALQWFCRHVWPGLKSRVPAALFRIIGFNPSPKVLELSHHEGIEIHPNLADLRDEVSRNQVAVLPFTSGGGIKNKLLEAAGLGMACVCTPRACNGLRAGNIRPFLLADHPQQWIDSILQLWNNGAHRRELGTLAREWVVLHHSWQEAAEDAVNGLRKSLGLALTAPERPRLAVAATVDSSP